MAHDDSRCRQVAVRCTRSAGSWRPSSWQLNRSAPVGKRSASSFSGLARKDPAGCYGPGGAGGAQHQADAADFVACLAGDLERTLGGESCQSQSAVFANDWRQRDHDDGRIVVASSTVTAGAARSTRPLDYSGINTAEDCNPDRRGRVPRPAASSFVIQRFPGRIEQTAAATDSQRARKQQQTRRPFAATLTTRPLPQASCLSLPTQDSHLDVATPAGARNLHYCYLDNDLTAHRPQARRTRSGRRHCGRSSVQLRSCSGYRVTDIATEMTLTTTVEAMETHSAPCRKPAPPPPTAQKFKTRPSDAARDSLDFPARLRKRVRFADALGFDLASVVLIAGAAAARSNIEFGAQFLSDEDLCCLIPQQAAGRPIALESVASSLRPSQILELTARVLNIAPEKRVMARVTL
uniref:Uncharacterized protein n=1 Tax=Macrostomum lignano TaxID=282301 RepID=A0A1I8FR59_9PLAT